MCKQMFFTNTSKLSHAKLCKILFAANKYLATREKDGFGWVATNSDGSFVGERYIAPAEFQFRPGRAVFKAPWVNKKRSNYFGKLKSLEGPLLIHGRTSTNTISTENTHPFLKHDWALVHNGVVNNTGADYDRISSCDTEHLIQTIATSGMKGIEENITGYYAFGAIDTERNLHVVKDNMANLFCGYIKFIDSHVFGTTRDLIESVCQELNWKVTSIEQVSDNTHLVFKGNEVVSASEFKPKGTTWQANQYAGKSIGKTYPNAKTYWGSRSGSHSRGSYNGYDDDAYGNYWEDNRPPVGTHMSVAGPASEGTSNLPATLPLGNSGKEEIIEQTDYDTHEDAERALLEGITDAHTILYVDGVEIELDDYKTLPYEEKIKCIILDEVTGEWIRFKDDSSV